ncbi:MAG: hypothetical protein Q8P95_02055 [bacterium]|nr:hypothetical protein [bacterium]
MAKTFQLVVRTPDRELENREVDYVQLATEDMGLLTILHGHASLSGTIFLTRMIIRGSGFEEEYILRRGLVFVSLESKTVTVMAYHAEKTREVQLSTVSEYLRQIEEALHGGPERLNELQVSYLQNEKLAVSKHLKDFEKV